MTITETAKGKALELALAQIEKAYGREAIMRLGERAAKIKVETIPTGVLSLDLALGVGGLAYLVFLPVGFALPPRSPATRCALTAPFHPYPASRAVYFLWHFP